MLHCALAFVLSLPPSRHIYTYICTYTNTQTHIFFFHEVRLLGFKINISVQMATFYVLFMQHNKNQKIIHPFIVNVIIKLLGDNLKHNVMDQLH